MNDEYRTYMDRIHAPAGLHEKLLAGEAPAERGPGLVRLIPAAACCGLVLAGCLWGVRLAAGFQGPGVEPALAGTPAPAETAAPATRRPEAGDLPQLSGTPQSLPLDRGAYTLTVNDPFDGQPHGDFNLPGVEIDLCEGEGAGIAVDWGFPRQTTTTWLTTEDMLQVLGGGETGAVPWTLYWAGFDLSGYALFDEEGAPLTAVISGERDGTTIGLTLTPDSLPPEDVIYGETREQEYDGTGKLVKAYYVDLKNGEYLYRAECMSGDTGVRLDVTTADQDQAATLVLHFLRAAVQEACFDIQGLTMQEEHFAHRGYDLTLEEAYQTELGDYLPRYLPDGFTCDDSAWCAERRGWDNSFYTFLSANWSWGYDYVNIGVTHYAERQKVAADGPLAIAYLDPDGITAGALEAIGTYVDNDRGDKPGWRFQFYTAYEVPGGSVEVNYSIKGLSPQEAERVVNSCAYSMCTGVPTAPTPSAGVE